MWRTTPRAGGSADLSQKYLIAYFSVVSGERVALQAYEYPDGQTGVSRREEHNRLMVH